MKKFLIQIALACALLFPALTFAAQTPEQFVRESIATMKTKGLSSTVNDVHPDELKRFKDLMSPVFTEGGPNGLAVMTTAFFDKAMTRDEFDKLDGAEMLRALIRKMETGIDGPETAIKLESSEVIGTVMEGKLAHVITRTTVSAGEIRVTDVEVVTVMPYKDGWKMMLSSEMEGLGQAIKQGILKGQQDGKEEQED